MRCFRKLLLWGEMSAWEQSRTSLGLVRGTSKHQCSSLLGIRGAVRAWYRDLVATDMQGLGLNNVGVFKIPKTRAQAGKYLERGIFLKLDITLTILTFFSGYLEPILVLRLHLLLA